MKHLIIVLLLTAGCGSLQKSYIEADQKTLNVFEPRLNTWIAAEVDTDTRAELQDLLISWKARVKHGVASVSSE